MTFPSGITPRQTAPAVNASLLYIWGVDITLPDASVIRGCWEADVERMTTQASNTYYYNRRIGMPVGEMGTLEERQVITIEGATYYVVGIVKDADDWAIAELRNHADH